MPDLDEESLHARATTSVLGHRVERREDPPLLTGSVHYGADLVVDDLLHAVFVRSTVSHGVVRGLDLSGARALPGVVAALAASDLELADIPEWPPGDFPPRPLLATPCLARDRVRYVGEPIAVVVAESAALAVDAAEQVFVDVEPLPPVVDPLEALSDGAPLLFPELGSNVVLEAHDGEEDGVAEPAAGEGAADGPAVGVLEGADVVVRARFVNQRVAPVPLEPMVTLALPAPTDGVDVVASTQAPFPLRAGIALSLGIDREQVRVRTAAVGGGFGAKGGVYPEQVVVAALARRLGRPVRAVETRSENLLAMSHGRGQVQDVALGARRDGTIVGLRARMVTDTGAYSWRGAISFNTARLMVNGVYRIPRLSVTSLEVVTNKTPLGPYRGAGRPEAAAMIERAMDMLAVELGMDPVDVRRKNLLAPEDFPYTTASGAVYDSGRYADAMDLALETSGYADLRRAQAKRRAEDDPLAMGVGLATFVEVSGSGPEYGALHVGADGDVVVTTGASPHGQGLETTLAQIVSSVLGVRQERVAIVHSDTAKVAHGIGTFGSRSGQLGGNAVGNASRAVLEQAKAIAADRLEVAPEDLVASDDGLSVAGVPSRVLGWAEIAAEAPGGALDASGDFVQPDGTYPFGAHVAVVDVDTETGRVWLRRLVAVDDCGFVVNPLIVEGQIHGGLAQGVAQALFEEVRYDELGTPQTATLADYGFPSAAELPSFELAEMETPSPHNPLGMKGVGESGSVGATVAVQNAVVDALAPWGVRHLDMPLGAERVWQALDAAARQRQATTRS